MHENLTAQALVQAHVDIATLKTEVKHLTLAIEELKTSNADLVSKLETISSLLTEAKGGWRVMVFLGGAAASLGAIISWALDHLTFK